MRLFISVDLDDTLREKIFELSRFFNIRGVKAVEKENIHITLKFLGEVKSADSIIKKLEEVEHPPFNIEIKGIGFFPSQSKMRVVWVGVEKGRDEITTLAKMIEDKMAKLGFKKENRFVPHATIARIKRIDSGGRSKLLKALEDYSNFEFGEMIVDKFHLKRSTLTPKGPIYDDVRVFKLS